MLAIVEDSPDVAVVPVAQVEVIGDGKDFVRGRERSLHGDRLQALVVARVSA